MNRTAKKRTSNTSKAATTRRPATKPAKRAAPATKSVAPAAGKAASRLIDQRIRELGDWRGETLARMRKLILEADPEIVEEAKWAKASNPNGVPVWSRNGIITTGETYAKVVKLTFAKGASLPDPSGLFNASLDGGTRRAIDIREGEKVDARAFKALVTAAVAANVPASKRATPRKDAKVTLLSGGNPQIAKGEGDAPVQAYIAAMPDWKRDVGERLDALIVRAAPNVRKAVKWNSPFYGIEGRGWFANFHVFARYVKVTFFKGAALRPVPPGAGKDPDARWIDVHEGELDEAQMTKWVKQAAKLPGWIP